MSVIGSSCELCGGSGWLCEEHTRLPWEHEECGAAGFACACNPQAAVAWQEVVAEVPRDTPIH